MTSGGLRGAVTYQQLVEYVARVTDPMEEHMSKHDTWHLDRLTAEDQAQRANRIAIFAVVVTLVSLIVEISLQLTSH